MQNHLYKSAGGKWANECVCGVHAMHHPQGGATAEELGIGPAAAIAIRQIRDAAYEEARTIAVDSDSMPVWEIQCPSCLARIRARMSIEQ